MKINIRETETVFMTTWTRVRRIVVFLQLVAQEPVYTVVTGGNRCYYTVSPNRQEEMF